MEVSPDVESRISQMQRGGQALPDGERTFFETHMGADFSHVRVHTDANAVQTCRALKAHAFTTGGDIAFNAGAYRPGTDTGRRLLGHELAHVVQQGAAGGAVLQRKADASVLGGALEDENTPCGGAELAQRASDLSVQRACGRAGIGTGVAGCTELAGDAVGDLILFQVNCDDFLGPGEQTKVDDFADSMSDTDRVKVHGFASVDGPADYNMDLSCARAKKAADVLAGKGIPRSRMELFKHGPTPGAPGNRRSVVLERDPPISRLATPQLSAVVNTGPDPGVCGGMNFVVDWQLSRNASANGGYVLQEVLFNWDTRDCTGAPVPNPDPRTSPLRYFEVWRVAPNSTNLSPVTTDTFFWPGSAPWAGGCTDGEVSITATARYHDDVPVADLPGHMIAGNPATFAGGLQSSLTDPALAGNVSRDVPHSLTFHWICCPCSSSATVLDGHTP